MSFINIEKTFDNAGGNILVRFAPKTQSGRCGIVEMLHLYNENKSGCCIGAWRDVNSVGGKTDPYFYSIGDRIVTTGYTFDILEALKYGQKLAEDSIFYKFDDIL